MQAHKLVLLVLDFEGYGPEQIEMMASNARGLDPSVMSIETRDIGEWTDDHPLNKQGTAEAEFDRLFAPVSTPQQSAQRASVDTPAVQQQAEPDPDRDPLYDKAVAVVRAHQRASLSLVQRTLLIGYNRTARLFEAMEKAGVISPFDENGHRTVLPAAPSPAPQGEQA